jgi:hypothetical protein
MVYLKRDNNSSTDDRNSIIGSLPSINLYLTMCIMSELILTDVLNNYSCGVRLRSAMLICVNDLLKYALALYFVGAIKSLLADDGQYIFAVVSLAGCLGWFFILKVD